MLRTPGMVIGMAYCARFEKLHFAMAAFLIEDEYDRANSGSV
jgi:hypothetical protein